MIKTVLEEWREKENMNNNYSILNGRNIGVRNCRPNTATLNYKSMNLEFDQ